MATRPSPNIEVNGTSPVSGRGGPLVHLLQRATRPFSDGARGGRDGREPGTSERSKRIVDNLQQVDRILSGLPHRMTRWLRDNDELPSLLSNRLGSSDLQSESGSSLAHQLNVLAGTIRRAGERFHEPNRSDRVARRIENVAQHLRETIRPPFIRRLRRLCVEHPVVSFSAALGVGYALYRTFHLTRSRGDNSEERVEVAG